MWAPIKELERRNACFMACEGYKPSFPFNQALGAGGAMNLMNKPAYNSPEAKQRRKLEAAKQFLKDHPCNPGVLNRWLDSRKTK